jgi:hypothetical protein
MFNLKIGGIIVGYTTEFNGSFQFSRKLNDTEIGYINTFSGTRRMKRDPNKLMELYKGEHGLPNPDLTGTPKLPMSEGTVTIINKDGENLPATNPYGVDGEYFCMNDSFLGQSYDESIINSNTPPKTQPGLWCQWVVDEDGTCLSWDQGEKFYDYIEWLQYLIKNFFEPWGVKLNGEVEWRGEDWEDNGTIVVTDNKVTTE